MRRNAAVGEDKCIIPKGNGLKNYRMIFIAFFELFSHKRGKGKTFRFGTQRVLN
jgi:hypothetical protein